jgi:hypothetical protein
MHDNVARSTRPRRLRRHSRARPPAAAPSIRGGPDRVKSEYSRPEDLATAGSGVFYLPKTLKNLP